MKLRMVDRILDWAPWRCIRGVKAVSFEEYSLKQPFGEAPRLPETLVLASLFHLGNWLITLSSDFSLMGIVGTAGEVRFASPVGPGERMLMEVTVERRRRDGLLLSGVGRVGSREVASGAGWLVIPVPLTDFHDPDDLRTLYSEIGQSREGPAS